MKRENYIYEYRMEKRIRTLTKRYGLISFMFRGLDIVPPSKKNIDKNVYLLNLISNLRKIRYNLKNSGASPIQIEAYDNKAYNCFLRSISTVRDRAIDIDNPYMTRDINLLNDISAYFIIWLSENLI